MSQKIPKPSNPFDKAENLQSFFEGDPRYSQVRDANLSQFMTQYNLKSLNPLNPRTFSLFNFIKTHVVASSLIILLLAGTLSAAAAELVAPQNLKPSNFFSEKKTTEESPTTYSQKVDNFDFEYNSELSLLKANGTVSLESSCYEVITSEIIPTNMAKKTTT
jgi:hypothetical protein